MDREIQECLLYIQQNASEVRKQGKDWGMNDEEINRCVNNALKRKIDISEKLSPDKIAVRFKMRKSWNCLRCLVKYAVILTAFAFVFCFAGYYISNNDNNFRKLVQPHIHKLMSVVRLVGLPLHKLNPEVSEYYFAECIIKNPLWIDPDINCERCSTVKTVGELDIKLRFLDPDTFYYPLIHKNLLPRSVHLEDIKTEVQKSKVDLSRSTSHCASTVHWSLTALDFVNNATMKKIKESHDFKFHWNSHQDLQIRHIMRILFPTPRLLKNDKCITSTTKYLAVDGPNASEYQLPNWDNGLTLYSQGLGSRMLKFTPVKICEDRCPSFEVNVTERDIVTYSAELWDVSVLSNGQDVSISSVANVIMVY